MKKELVPSEKTYADLVESASRTEEFLRRWITGVMAGLSEVDEETAKMILKKAGEDCCKLFLVTYELDLSNRSLDSLIEWWNSRPACRCYKEDENTIIYEFKSNKCECLLVAKGFVNLTPRLCSTCFTNWLEYMFSTVAKRKVKAELIETLATGASKCSFRIRLL